MAALSGIDKIIILKGGYEDDEYLPYQIAPKDEKSKSEQLRYPLVIKVTLPPLYFLRPVLGCQNHYSIVSDAGG